MKVRPSPAILGALLVAAVLHLLTRTTGVAWLALGSGAALALPVTALLLRPALSGLQVSVKFPAMSTVGQVVQVELAVVNTGSRSSPPAVFFHENAGFEPLVVALPAMAAGASAQVTADRLAVRRGVYEQSHAWLQSSAPFGMLRWSTGMGVTAMSHVVRPPLVQVHAIPTGGVPMATERSLPVPGAGNEVLGLRPWRQGDGARAVSARASARHGRPVVLERERETGSTLVVLAVGGGRGDVWERAVAIAASLAVAALKEGCPPLLIAAPPARPAPRRADTGGVLDFFAGIDAAGPLRDLDVKTALHAVGPGGTLVLLAPPGAFEHTIAVRRAAAAAGCRVEALGG